MRLGRCKGVNFLNTGELILNTEDTEVSQSDFCIGEIGIFQSMSVKLRKLKVVG